MTFACTLASLLYQQSKYCCLAIMLEIFVGIKFLRLGAKFKRIQDLLRISYIKKIVNTIF